MNRRVFLQAILAGVAVKGLRFRANWPATTKWLHHHVCPWFPECSWVAANGETHVYHGTNCQCPEMRVRLYAYFKPTK